MRRELPGHVGLVDLASTTGEAAAELLLAELSQVQAAAEVALRQGCDEGRPLVATAPESPAAKVFLEMARRLATS